MDQGAGIVESFMEITSCGSDSVAVSHLSSCGWRLDDAINLYFSTGPAAADPVVPRESDPIQGGLAGADADGVRAPIPARSETLYNVSQAAGSSNAYTAPSIWAVERKPPTVQPVDVEMQEASMSESGIKANVRVANKGEEQVMERAEDVGTHRGAGAEDEAHGADDGMETSDQEDGYDDSSYGYDTEAEEDSNDEQDDDDSYLQAAETDHLDALEGPGHLPRQRADNTKTLDDLFQPPHKIMFKGSFHEAKIQAARTDRWLLVNVQSPGVFTSHLHNRDLWSNEVVVQVIKDNFVFSLMEKQSTEGGKVCCFYRLDDDQLPAVLVLDPITGQLLDKWCGLVQDPGDFLTSIGKYTESKPGMLSRPKKIVKRAATPEPTVAQEPAIVPKNPVLPSAQEPAPVPKNEAPAAMAEDEQPMEGETVCKLRVRFPSGNTVTKEFGSKRRVSALFAYCRSVDHEQKGTEQAFRIMRFAAGRTFVELRNDDASFEDLKLNRDTVTVVMDTCAFRKNITQ
ncbi:putative plant UBX domain-containing protein 14 [Brachypodium distachyon]|uniref:UBX domain-containing protein n=1 Tax=Brachypodium distachyon TaxID=15368 RepID=I1IBZ8_BRADI|nr:putative plant UBX domain-containing protein 14 [Brachypodium distachyon]KQK00506.1 hypothetical protein BRADI_3g49920v3 [Brachypodium distachyon]|eukprot:XP_003572752.1 putative plant UBX domain-containing protein 14 [Brachypodium distachyon]